jgi:tetratricopeptide (TPR) repeat protein
VPSARTEVVPAFQGDAQIRKAITYLEGQLKTQTEAAGADDVGLATIDSRLANLYLLVSDPRQSEAIGRRGLAILEKHGGARSAESVEFHATLAEALADLGRYEAADAQLQSALQLAREVHGEVHEVTVDALNQAALLRIAQRRFADAERLALEALDTHQRLAEPGSARAAFLTSTLAWALIEQGRAPEAIQRMDIALDAIKPGDPPAPYLVALGHHFRGEALNRVGQYPRAERDFRTELELFGTIAHVKMDEARAISGLAEARLMQGAISEAATLLEEAQELLRDGEGWRESKARHENALRLEQLRELAARTK